VPPAANWRPARPSCTKLPTKGMSAGSVGGGEPPRGAGVCASSSSSSSSIAPAPAPPGLGAVVTWRRVRGREEEDG
jgi:hypothetical protein